MKVLDLFSGIGGFSLAAHWMGWSTVAFCEKDDYCKRVLRKNFGQDILIHDDITATDFTVYRGRIDLLTGGFPCQPFSCSGNRRGTKDDRYLWHEMFRAIREVEPRWVIAENVANLANMVFDQSPPQLESSTTARYEEEDVCTSLFTQQETMQLEHCCKDLESIGYSVQPFVIPACAVNAPHRRDRVWIVAHSSFKHEQGRQESGKLGTENQQGNASQFERPGKGLPIRAATNANSSGFREQRGAVTISEKQPATECNCNTPASPQSAERERSGDSWSGRDGFAGESETSLNSCQCRRHWQSRRRTGEEFKDGHSRIQAGNEREGEFEPCLCGADDGLPGGLDGFRLTESPLTTITKNRRQRLQGLGNAIVPQVAYQIFSALEQAIND